MTDTPNTTTTVITPTSPPSTTTIIAPSPSPLSKIAKVFIPILIIGMILIPPVAAVLAIAGAAHSHTNQGWVVPKPPISTPVTPPTPPVVVTPAQTNYVQLGSYTTVDAAKKALQAFTKRNSSYYNILDLRVYKVTINGILWYRIVFPTDSLDAANTICDALKKGGQDCIVLTF